MPLYTGVGYVYSDEELKILGKTREDVKHIEEKRYSFKFPFSNSKSFVEEVFDNFEKSLLNDLARLSVIILAVLFGFFIGLLF